MALTNAYLNTTNGSGNAALATVSSNRSIGSTTIAVSSTANWPQYFIATSGTLLSSGFMNPTTCVDFYGHLNSGNIIIDGFCAGNSDAGNTAGQVVVIKPNTPWSNMIAQGVQNQTLFPYQFANFVEPGGGVWSQSSGLAGVQTAGNCWYQGVRYSLAAVASYTFTASQDTYVDYNPATSAFTYVPVANGASEPSVTASCVRVAKVITNASAIAQILQAKYTTPMSSSLVTAGGVWWQEIGRATSQGGITSLTVGVPAFTYLRIVTNVLPSAAYNSGRLQFNGDTGSTNYPYRVSSNGGADSTGATNGLAADVGNATQASPTIMVMEGVNILSQEKVFNLLGSDAGAAGNNTPNRRTGVSKWSNTSAQITSITLALTGVNLNAGSELIVLGHN